MSMSLEQYISQLTPLLDEVVIALVRDRPSDPIKFLIDYLQSREKRRGGGEGGEKEREEKIESPKNVETVPPVVNPFEITDPDISHAIVSSPTSQGLLSPTHSPSNVARYLNQGQRASIPAVSTGDLMRRFEDGHQLDVATKSKSEHDKIFNLFRKCVLFNDKLMDDLVPVIDAMKEEVFPYMDTEISVENSVVFVSAGGLETERMCKNNLDLELKGPGDIIGELSEPCEILRVVTTEPNTLIYRIERDYFEYLIRLCSLRRRERLMRLVSSVPILSSMEAEEQQKISDALRHEHFTTGQVIVKQGDEGHTFHIVESGACVVTKSFGIDDVPQEVDKYGPGDYFGELSLVRNEPRAASVVAASEDVSVLSLDRQSFKRLLGPIEDLLVRDYGEI